MESIPGLTLDTTIEADSSTVRVEARVATGGFAGTARGYVEPEELAGFCQAASAFPLEGTVALRIGGDDIIVRVQAFDGRGQLDVDIELNDTRFADRKTRTNQVRISMTTTYSDLESFIAALRPATEHRARSSAHLRSSSDAGAS